MTTTPSNPGAPITPGALRGQAVGKIVAILLVVVVALGGMLYYLDIRKAKQEDQRANAKQHVLLRPRDEANDWRAKEGGRVEQLNREIETLQREVRNMKERDEREQARQTKADAKADAPAPGRSRTRADGGTASPPPALKDILPPLPGADGQPQSTGRGGRSPQLVGPSEGKGPLTIPGAPLPPPSTKRPDGPAAGADGAPEGLPGLGTPSTPSSPFGRPGESGGPRASAASALGSDTGKIRAITPRNAQGQRGANTLQAEKVGWLPSGSIIPGVLLSGVDAATGQGNSQPYPVLIRLTDTAILPNGMSMDVIGCTLIGAAVGDLAAERVSIRTEGMACLLRRGGGLVTIDGDFKAAVIGPDGKLAIRGRVVQKEGAIIARALTAGFVSGLSDAFKPNISYAPFQLGGTTTATNAASAFAMPPPQQVLTAAGLAGVGKSMELLSKYYLDLAQQIHPVIEIQAGTPVDIMVLKGIALRWRSSAPVDNTAGIIE
jgi:predicted Holliday junction resolvase-like endonuclease